MTQQTTTISPDGQWEWDGTDWVPNTTGTMAGTPLTPPVADKPKRKRLGLMIMGGIIGGLTMVGIAAGGGGGDATTGTAPQSEASVQVAEEPVAEVPEVAAEEPAAEVPAVVAEVPAVVAEVPAPAPEPVVPQAPTETVAQENARESAESYLRYMSFSRSGLIEQLEFEGYSTADATYAVDAVSPDWNEQAAKSAQSYLEHMSFSRSGLIEQLEFEGFTNEQAVYGVNTTGL